MLRSATILTIVSLLWFQDAHAGILWECRVTGEVLSAPTLVGDRFEFEFRGQSVSPEFDDFCRDRVDVVATLRLLVWTFDKIGRPTKGSVITLVEHKEENDVGHGLTQWRYFVSGTVH